jgi:hypothetical protein
MPLRTLDLAACKGQWVKIVARNPASVCCEEALLVCALRSVGVTLHPAFPFAIRTEEIGGELVTTWRWLLAVASVDGLYATGDLLQWWADAAWQAANPKHEFALVCAVVRNMGVVAADVRATVPRAVVRQGRTSAFIPATASPARRSHLLAQLDGTIPVGTPFVEPAAV